MRIVVSLFALSIASTAQAQASAPSKDRSRTDLMHIENEIAIANQKCDYAYFRKVEADEFVFTGANGQVTTRAEDLAGESTCKPNLQPFVIDEPRLLFYGTTAVLNARNSTTVTRANGDTVTVRSRFTDVFVWRDGRWQLVAGHSSRIPAESH